MILGFTFYFVLWHSLFSLKNIFKYLGKDGMVSQSLIAKQISFYSLISFVGFIAFAFAGVLILNYNSLLAYVFLMDGSCVNEVMIKEGYAKPYSRYYCDALPLLQQLHFSAKTSKLGLFNVITSF